VTNADDSRPVKVFCPVCQELLEAVPAEAIQRLPCPLCGSEVVVPSRAHAAMATARKRIPTPEEIGEYAIAAPVETPQPAAASHAAASPAQSTGLTAKIPCPNCKKKVGTRLEERPKRVNCPHCGVLVDVPARGGAVAGPVAGTPPASTSSKPAPTAEPPAPSPKQPPPRPAPAGNVFDAMAGVRIAEIDPPPRWTFFSGVFQLPFRGQALPRWALLSAGFTLLCLIGALAHWLAQGDPTRLVVRLVLLGLPSLWIALLSASYGAALALAIIEGTAAGNDRLHAWPEPNWREWLIPLIAAAWIAALCASLGYGLGRLLELAGLPAVWSMAACSVVLFPAAVLCALESGQVLLPFSVPVLRSIPRWWWAWGLFEVLGAMVLCLPAVVGWLLFDVSRLAAALAAGPLLAACLMIYARLLGRLGWRISGVEHRLKRLRMLAAEVPAQR